MGLVGTGTTTSVSTWDFNGRHVAEEVQGGDFVRSASCLICAGPPNIRFAGDNAASGDPIEVSEDRNEINGSIYPIGLVQDFGMSQAKNIQELVEIGSKIPYFVPGRTVRQVQLSRTVYHGANLLRVLYAWYPNTKINPSVVRLLEAQGGDLGAAAKQLAQNPGFADFFSNLDSDLFDNPLGLLVIMRTNNNEAYAGFYLEGAYISNHNIGISAQSELIAEGANLRFTKVIPVNVGAVAATTITRAS